VTDSSRPGAPAVPSTPPGTPSSDAGGKVEVLGPDQTKNLEQIQVIIGSIAGPLMDGHKLTEEQSTERLRTQLRYQFAHTVVGSIVVLVAISIAAYFAWSGITQGRFEFAERIVFVIIGVAIGFISGRMTRIG
jgi:cytochrome bd-type quinol oxidase subunit 1